MEDDLGLYAILDNRGWAMRHGRKRRMAGRRDNAGGPGGCGRAVFSRSSGKNRNRFSRSFCWDRDLKPRLDVRKEGFDHFQEYHFLHARKEYMNDLDIQKMLLEHRRVQVQEIESTWAWGGKVDIVEAMDTEGSIANESEQNIDQFLNYSAKQRASQPRSIVEAAVLHEIRVRAQAEDEESIRLFCSGAMAATDFKTAGQKGSITLESKPKIACPLEVPAMQRTAQLSNIPKVGQCCEIHMSAADKIAQVRVLFLSRYQATLIKNLKLCFTDPIRLEPTTLSDEIMERFLQVYRSSSEIIPALHGTHASNHSSICSKGLLMPGTCGRPVSHGCCHGIGVYVSKVHNSMLSRSFCSEPRMLVCAVIDDAVKVAPHRLGSFMVTAESANIRHVGDALVVFDPRRVVPLFEASGKAFVSNIAHHARIVTCGTTPIAPPITPASYPALAPIPHPVRPGVAPCSTASSCNRFVSVRRRMGPGGKKREVVTTLLRSGGIWTKKTAVQATHSPLTGRRSFQGAPRLEHRR